ncbi:cellulose binding domain-containing protein [Micromonospora matsumotoense]|uniref:cellulose binding domain-containing protein n=1 Tax=Micromonospora matsumotoense TaxID=121616 RepID=UPI003D932DE4
MRETRFLRRRPALVAATATALLLVTAAATQTSASAAAAGCQVNYTVSSSWQGGFRANVTVTNLGDAVNGWRLTWSYPAGQTVTQLWNGSYTQASDATENAVQANITAAGYR